MYLNYIKTYYQNLFQNDKNLFCDTNKFISFKLNMFHIKKQFYFLNKQAGRRKLFVSCSIKNFKIYLFIEFKKQKVP